MKKSKIAVICLCIASYALIFGGTSLLADNPRSFFAGMFRAGSKTNVTSGESFELDETKGPWLIYVKCYDGANARDDAYELAQELRTKHQLFAYVFHSVPEAEDESVLEDRMREKEILESLAQAGQGDIPLYMPTKKRKSQKLSVTTEQYAVVVGNFQSINDNDINRTFEKIKGLESDCVVAQMQRETAEAERTGTFDKSMLIDLTRMSIREQTNNTIAPFVSAIKSTNPLLPAEYFTNRVDDFVQKLNKDSQYSLLRCPGKYTVKVAEFGGNIVADPKQIAAIEKNEKILTAKSKLERAGDKAENVCHALREKGWEAYTFHDRTRSIVTVGSFNSLGQKDRDGVIVEYDPQIVNIYNIFSVGDISKIKEVVRPSRDEQFQIGKSILNIPLLPFPEPMEVPKPYLSYGQR
jgi:hypothetical protein